MGKTSRMNYRVATPREMVRKGGSVKVPTKGFGMMSLINPEKHRQASIKGGTNSSRVKNEKV